MRIAIGIVLLLAVLAAGGVLVLAQTVQDEDLRDQVIRQAESITGRPVAVEGRVDLSLLPQPTLTLAGAVFEGHTEMADGLRLEVDRVDLEVAPLALLRGRIAVSGVRLVRPVLHVAATEEPRLLGLLRDGLGLPLVARGVGRLSVVDGRAVLGGPANNAAGALERINLDLIARDARGPFEMSGVFAARGQRFRLDARLGRLTADPTTTLQVEIAHEGAAPEALRLGFRGLVTGAPEARLRGRISLRGGDAQGALATLAGALGHAMPPLPAWARGAFEVSGALTAVPAEARLNDLGVRIAGVEARGRARLTRAEPPQLALELTVPQLGLGDGFRPDGTAFAALAGLATRLDGRIDLTVDRLDYRGRTARRARLTLGLSGEEGPTVEQARATLPGNADVRFTGLLRNGTGAPELHGRFTGVTGELGVLLDWLGLASDDAGRRPRSLSLATDLEAGPETLRLRDLELRLDASRITGSLALDLGDRRQAAAALAVDRLDLDTYWPGAAPDRLLVALEERLGISDLALDARVAQLTWQGLRWQDVALDGRAIGEEVTIRHLAADGVADSVLRLAGTIDLAGRHFELEGGLETPRPALLLRRLGFAPPPPLARLRSLVVDGSAAGWGEGMALDLELAIDEVDVALAGDLALPARGPPRFALEIEASHPAYADVVRRLGLTSPLGDGGELAGPFGFAGTLRRDARDSVALTGSAELGDARVTGEVSWRRTAGRPEFRARLSLGNPTVTSLMPLLRLAGVRPDPVLITRPWLGNLPRRPIDLAWLEAADGRVEISGKGGLAGDGLSLRAELGEGRLVVEQLAGELAGGRIEAELAFDAGRRAPFLALALTLGDVDAAGLAALFDLPPVLSGRMDLYAEATAAGRSPFDLVRGLGGDLALSVRDGTIRGLPPAPGTAADADGNGTRFTRLDGQFDIKRGLAEVTAMRLELDGARGRIEGIVDLLVWIADLELTIEPEDGRSRAYQIVGPLGRPAFRPLPRDSPPPHDAPAPP